MVAYSFKERFIAPIEAGTKTQTIRAVRTGRSPHARPGQQLQLYYAMRTKQCRLIRRATCVDVVDIKLSFGGKGFALIGPDDGDQQMWEGHMRDHFARADGFKDWADLKAFWQAEHGDKGNAIASFEGVLIRWEV